MFASSPLTLSCTAAQPLFSSANPEDEEFLDTFTGSGEIQDQDTICFADKLIDIDFLLLRLSARSTAITLPTVLPNRKRPIWKDSSARLTDEFLLKKSVKKTIGCRKMGHMFSESDEIDVTTDSTPAPLFSSIRKEGSETKHHGFRGQQLLSGRRVHAGPGGPAPYKPYTLYKYRLSEEPTMEELSQKLKEGALNAREEMHLLRLSCPCQSRNTGKSTHLWEFLLELLADKRMKSVIAWTGHAREFKVVNSREVAREWGNRKNKPHMNFDKMSRAMRYYYKKNILTHGNKQRLVYSFCNSAICPHYEKIVKLALRTRPSTTQPGATPAQQGSPVRQTVPDNWDDSENLLKNAASHNLKVESEKMLTQRLCPQQGISQWSVKKSRRFSIQSSLAARRDARGTFTSNSSRGSGSNTSSRGSGSNTSSRGSGSNTSSRGSGSVTSSRGCPDVRRRVCQDPTMPGNKNTCYWRSTPFNKNTEQTKIKISHTKLSHTDCFQFS